MTPTVWLCHQTTSTRFELPPWLNASEHTRALPCQGTRRAEFLSSRWLIRQALAGASGEAPSACSPSAGRPTESQYPPDWRLSLSHSNGIAACATNLQGEVGLDIEPCQRRPNWQKVVQRWFSPVEQEWLLAQDDALEFLKVWTLKEAWLKATARGIAGNLQTLEVRRGFELYGDQCDSARPWQACCIYVDGFLVTLVYRRLATEAPETPLTWPPIRLLEPPLDDYRLTPADTLDSLWEPLLQRPIRSMASRDR
ncbi:4'-phosphopantetheinyl transferase family protein [Marinobacter sp. LV10MA510-1]|uniref:4'-phosphopantetheinyl transferase family protein n=1 Tax=Marinobacter sp. LV10MA510-1 TaxID=1415567 RepID=UPI000C005ABD|nr:4'-phosphopantetheinyl transferase superfamily protein [Marinobacter sp. LV10MA510-1]PFG10421.1 4'-phosphopantetheinyl transferase [Marinobacter sp. LV10MA510-1]